MNTLKLAASVLVAGLVCTSASAAVVGDFVDGVYTDLGGPDNFFLEDSAGVQGFVLNTEVVADDFEFALSSNNLVNLDIDESSVTLNFADVEEGILTATWSVTDFDVTLTSLVLTEGNASLIDAGNTGIIDSGDGFEITFLDIFEQQSFVFGLTTAEAPQIPLPASIVLLLGGLGLLGFTSRRKA